MTGRKVGKRDTYNTPVYFAASYFAGHFFRGCPWLWSLQDLRENAEEEQRLGGQKEALL